MAATPPCGLWLSASLARVDRPPAIDLTGDGAPSRMSRLVPAHIAAWAASGVPRHAHPAQRPQLAADGVTQVTGRLAEAGDDLPRHVRRGYQVAPQRLGQRPDHLGDQLGAQPGHLPGEFGWVDLVEPAQRDV